MKSLFYKSPRKILTVKIFEYKDLYVHLKNLGTLIFFYRVNVHLHLHKNTTIRLDKYCKNELSLKMRLVEDLIFSQRSPSSKERSFLVISKLVHRYIRETVYPVEGIIRKF